MSHSFLVTQFGAIGDGTTLNTRAIQKAIDAASAKGGELVFPAGTYLTGTVFLRSNMVVTLMPGAVLLGSSRLEDYTAVKWGHHMDRTPWHLVVAQGVSNVTLRGQGTIDGQGPKFWEPTRPSPTAFFKHDHHRPSPMVEFERCQDIRIEGILLTNSAGWTLHLWDCDRCQVHGLRIRNTLYGPNTDGIDITGCSQVIISDCNISTADDAIALKTTVDSRECTDITITNCILETSCVALRLGYEARHAFRRVTASNLQVINCSRVVDLRSLDGAVIEDVLVTNVVAKTNSGWPFHRPIEIYVDCLNNFYGVKPPHPNHEWNFPHPKPGAVRRVTLSHMNIETDGRIMIGAADPSYECRDIVLSDIRLDYPVIDDPSYLGEKVPGPSFHPGLPKSRGARAAIVAENVSDLRIMELTVRWPEYPVRDGWKLLTDDNRKCNPDYIIGHEEEIRTGNRKPKFHAFWGRNVQGGTIDLRRATGSEEGVSRASLDGSELRVLTD